MSLELQPSIFQWLQSNKIIQAGQTTSYEMIQLSEQISMKFYDGVLVAQVVKLILNDRPDAPYSFEKLDAIRENSTPANRLYNWNILCQVMKGLGLSIDYADKSKILNLYSGPVLKILQFLHTIHIQCRKSLPSNTQPQGLTIDLGKISQKLLNDANNILQFFVISISANFKITSQQALNLLNEKGKYLSHLMVKGIKNSFDSIFGLMGDIAMNMQKIIIGFFSSGGEQSVVFFMNAIKPALISKQPLVASNCIEVILLLHQIYQFNSMSLDVVKKWIKEEGINTILLAVRRYPQLFGQLIAILALFIQNEMFVYMQPDDKSLLWYCCQQKLNFFLNLITTLSSQNLVQFSQTDTFRNWLRYIQKNIKQLKQINEMRVLLQLIGQLWKSLHEKIEQEEDGRMIAQFMRFLDSCTRNRSEVLFYESIVVLFNLMEVLGGIKNQHAPQLFKILIDCFKICGSGERMSFITLNFLEAFLNLKNLPGGPVVQFLVINMKRQVSVELVQLCRVVIEENRVSQEQFVRIGEVLIDVVLHDVNYGQIALSCIFGSISTMNEEVIAEFLQRIMQRILVQFYSISSSITQKYFSLLPTYKSATQFPPNPKKKNSLPIQIKNHLILRNLINMYFKCSVLVRGIQTKIQPNLYDTYIRIKNQLNKQELALLLLPLMKLTGKDNQEIEKKLKGYGIQQWEEWKEEEEESDHRHRHRHRGSSLVNEVPEEESSIGDNIAIDPPTHTKNQCKNNNNSSMVESIIEMVSSSVVANRTKPMSTALKDLQRIKQKVENAKIMMKEHSREKELIQEQKNIALSASNEKRMIEFGVRGGYNVQYRYLYEWDTAKQLDHQNIYRVPTIKLQNFIQQEENSYLEEINWVMKKYRKVWRYLFLNYSSFGMRQRMNWEEKINVVEIWKMLKEYEVGFIKKEESQMMIKLVNEHSGRRNDLHNLTYTGFEEYIVQICSFGYSRLGYTSASPGHKIHLLISHLKNITQRNGNNTDIFLKPQQAYFQHGEILHEFNSRLRQNPEYILPQGYKKNTVYQLCFEYRVGISSGKLGGVGGSYGQVMEVLDGIIFGCLELGFHIVEPRTYRMKVHLAQPCLFPNLQQKIKVHSQAQGYMLPRRSQGRSTSQKEKEGGDKKVGGGSGFKQEFHPLVNFSLGIKLGVAGCDIRNRYIAEEVAYWMDDMLHAIQNGENIVQNRAKRKIDNEVKKQQRISMEQLKQKLDHEQLKWDRRAQSVKAQVNQNRQKQKEILIKKKKEMKQRKLVQKQKQQKQQKNRQNRYKYIKNYLQEKNKQREQLNKQAHDKLKKQQSIYSKQVKQYFNKKIQQIQLQQNIINQVIQQKEKIIKKEQIRKKQLIKKLHINILQKQQIILERVQEAKKSFHEICLSKQIRDTFHRYQGPLKLLFNLLVKQDSWKIAWGSNSQISLETLQIFAVKFKIVPFMIPKNMLIKIFKIEGRTMDRISGINFQTFIRILLRIAVKAKDMLNAVALRRKQKVYQNPVSNQSDEEMMYNNDKGYEFPVSMSNISYKNLTDEYLFNATGVTCETIQQFIQFLNLPIDKMGMDQRYKQVMEQKNIKPKSVLFKEMKQKLGQSYAH